MIDEKHSSGQGDGRKPVYSAPVVVDLGELARGQGQPAMCMAGSGVMSGSCKSGGTPTGTCKAGSRP